MDPKTLLKKYFGYDSFRPGQEEVILHILAHKDALVLMPTGGGKSICYQIPALMLPGTCLVVSPLISLMRDQVEALKALGIPAAALNSTNNPAEDYQIRRRCMEGELKLLYLSPERLLAEASMLLQDVQVSFVAIDEAHCISQWGHDFRPEYTELGRLRDMMPDVAIMALTATADKITRKDIIKQLRLRDLGEFVSSFDRPNLSLTVKRGFRQRDKLSFIVNFIKARPLDPGIIYCLSRKSTEQVADALRRQGINAAPYHAGMEPFERNRTQELFKRDDLLVVCATIAFGMGIDKSNVRWIIHYNMPKSLESYYQEIGRAGRDGAPAETILFYSLSDVIQLKKFCEESGEPDVSFNKLHRMQDYAEALVCRRRILLNYFGEEAADDCGNCDVCQDPPERFDGSRFVQMALSAAKRTQERVGVNTIVEILRGMNSPTIMRHQYSLLPTYGVGRELSVETWQDYLLQMYQMGFLDVIYNENNRAVVTPLGAEVLYGRRQAMLCLRRPEPPREKKQKKKHLNLIIPTLPFAKPQMEDTELFDALRLMRKDMADKEGVPPYIIFSDKVLHAIATRKPETIDDFGEITGIGEYKKRRHGKQITDFIRKFYGHG